MEQYRKEAKIKAIRAAKEKAESLTEAIGQKTGRALYIQEVYFNPVAIQTNVLQNVQYRSMQDSKVATDYDFENLKVESTILCRFELK